MILTCQDFTGSTVLFACRVYCDKPGHVAFSYKMWSNDAMWLPLPEQERLELFKLDSAGKQILPTCVPSIVELVHELRQNYKNIQTYT